MCVGPPSSQMRMTAVSRVDWPTGRGVGLKPERVGQPQAGEAQDAGLQKAAARQAVAVAVAIVGPDLQHESPCPQERTAKSLRSG